MYKNFRGNLCTESLGLVSLPLVKRRPRIYYESIRDKCPVLYESGL